MRLFAIGRNADDLNFFLIEFVARIPERTCLERSARGVVLWIEPKHDAFSLKIL